MDSRLHERHQLKLDLTVTDIAAPDRVTAGQIVNVSEAGLCADLSAAFDLGAIVKVQIADCTLFGHVTYCIDQQSFRTGIEIVRVLIGDSDLGRLVNAVLAETIPATPGVISV
jgi:hypothetical protein